MDKEYVKKHMIFETIVGSRAYGIHTSDSDYDYAGVMIPDKTFIYGINKFEQFQGWDEKDRVTYDIRKAIKLIADNNPNMIELLFVPERCIIKTTPYWEKIRQNSHLFISKKVRWTFSGYAISQLKKIKTHRKFLLSPIKKKPERKDFGLPEKPLFPQINNIIPIEAISDLIKDKESFSKQMDDLHKSVIILLQSHIIPEKRREALNILQKSYKSQLNLLLSSKQFIRDEFVEIAQKELIYYNALSEWKQYQEWKKHRNKARALLEEKHGYDTKHAAHLVRLLRMGYEILTTGKVNVDRTSIDAEELKAIRNGAWSYEKIENFANEMDNKLKIAYKTSKLPHSPNINEINKLTINVIEEKLQNEQKLIFFNKT